LVTRAKTLAGEDVFEVERRFSVNIHDDLGVETVSSVKDIPGGQFLDSTTQVRLDLDLRYGMKSFPLEVDVKFNKDRTYSNLTISYSGGDARSFVAGLHDGIMRLVLSAKNNNDYFNPHPVVEGALWFVSSIPLFAGSLAEKVFPNASSLGALVTALMYAYLIVGKKLRPYTAFDTPATERNAKLMDWFIYGVLGFIVFGSLFVMLRRNVLGF